jgi:hypothetical protein
VFHPLAIYNTTFPSTILHSLHPSTHACMHANRPQPVSSFFFFLPTNQCRAKNIPVKKKSTNALSQIIFALLFSRGRGKASHNLIHTIHPSIHQLFLRISNSSIPTIKTKPFNQAEYPRTRQSPEQGSYFLPSISINYHKTKRTRSLTQTLSRRTLQ